ncbi:hypothetical protein [Aquibacillus rhizosphaerae]|uniref:ABC transporter permease n=1 Tax=Aquibacillus rhizosphaerae TaxID=3051431 RepID=A0ABT7L2R6_9BACI|nr:hypothetical protein [Aquibacillus sp. LR5S19]MDL4840137.1 hypothetical protein [Aquibacillus sp. LR5S19]
MKSHPSVRRAHHNIRRGRWNKKKKLYKLAFGLSFDLTISIYVGLFTLFGGVILYDTIQQYSGFFSEIERFLLNNYLTILLVLIIRPLIGAANRPGILFSSAELQLSLLPYSIKELILLCMIEKWKKTLIILCSLALLLGLITPFSSLFLLSVTALIFVMDILMTYPQWRLYQFPFRKKFIYILLAILIVAITRTVASIFHTDLLLIVGLCLLIGMVGIILRDTRGYVNWTKVVQTNDLIIWNIWFINKMSEMEIKPPTRQGLLGQLFRSKKSKKPFRYRDGSAIYRKLWKLYFIDHREQVVQTIGSIIIILSVLSFHGPWLIAISISLSIFLYAQMIAGFFSDGFSDKLIFSIPWDLNMWRNAFLKWVFGVGIILLLCVIFIFLLQGDYLIWIPFQLLLYGSVAVYFIRLLISERISILKKQYKKITWKQTVITVLLFLIVINSVVYPWVSISCLILVFIQKQAWYK